MRRRSTFIHPVVDVDPRQLYVSGDRFVLENLKAAREERLTFGFNELPEELWQVLRQCYELHIRWASERLFEATPPFLSKISPGLHIFYTPLRGQSGDLLCPLLHRVFSKTLKCQSPLTTFTPSTTSLQYHSLLPSLESLPPYIQRYLCRHSDQSCIHSASLLNIADSFDIDYDSISKTLTLKVHWSRPPAVLDNPISGTATENAWSLTVDLSTASEKVEVGVFSNEKPTEPSHLSLSGFLTSVGEDTYPKPTFFSFPSRHHSLPRSQSKAQKYTVSFLQPTGLHPTMQISIPSASSLIPPSTAPPSSTCSLHTYLTLPSALFADKYQLSTRDPIFLSSHNLVSLRSISGATDLEAPDYVVKQWGSDLLLELATPTTSSKEETQDVVGGWDITIPLHLRYLPPSPSSSHSEIEIPWPVVFWACTPPSTTAEAENEDIDFSTSPFHRPHLGYDSLFPAHTMFYHLAPEPNPSVTNAASIADGRLILTLQVPILDMSAPSATWVEDGTVGVVIMGFLWVVWKLLGVGGFGAVKDGKGKEKEQ